MNAKLKSTVVSTSLMLCAAASSTALAQQIPIDATRISRPVMGETNNYRSARGVPELTVSEPLLRAAQQYAEYQARTNTTGHTADGRTIQQRILATNAYKPCFYAENVFEYWSQPSPVNPRVVADAAMQFWKNSPGHEANLRDPRARHIGVGAAAWTHGGRHYYKVVQVFANDCGAAVSPQGTPVPSTSTDVLRKGTGSGGATAIRLSMATCMVGYVWRVARPDDLVCVTPQSRARVAEENRTAALRVQPGGGAYGPNTCRSGFVWREAFNGDGVCVTPQVRAWVRMENAFAASRRL